MSHGTAAFGLAACGAKASASPLDGVEPPGQTEWFDALFSSNKASTGSLIVYRFADEIYALNRPIGWKPDPGGKPYTPVSVPEGFVTDFASVPRIFWTVLPRDGRYAYAAVLHDYLYWIQDRPREEADDILQIGMKEFGVDVVSQNAVYWGVRAGGWVAWAANAKSKAAGEKRILKKLPTDPLVKWSQWKTVPGVFA